MTKRIRFISGLSVAILSTVFWGCPSSSSQVKQNAASVKKSKSSLLLPQSSKKVLKKRYYKRLPAGIQTVRLKKGIALHLFLHPKNILKKQPYMSKQWANQMIRKGGSRSWYVRLKPDPGAKLGRFIFVRTIMAVWNAAGNFGVTSRMSAQFLLRRGKKETLLFSTMQLPKGQRYQAYDVSNREINYNSEEERNIKEGDILIFRMKHRSGNGGSVALGGGLGVRGNFFVLTPHNISNYYQYTK